MLPLRIVTALNASLIWNGNATLIGHKGAFDYTDWDITGLEIGKKYYIAGTTSSSQHLNIGVSNSIITFKFCSIQGAVFIIAFIPNATSVKLHDIDNPTAGNRFWYADLYKLA